MGVTSAEAMALGCAFLWAVNALILRSLSFRVAPATMNAVRCAAAAVVFLVWLPFDAPLSSLLAVPWTDYGLLLVSLVVGIVVGDTLYMVALRDIGVSRAMPLSGTFPLATLAFERLLLGTPLRPSLLAGSALVAAGVVLMGRARAPADPPDLLAARALAARAPADPPDLLAASALAAPDDGLGGPPPGRVAAGSTARGCVGRGVALALVSALLWGLAVTLLKPALTHLTTVQANAVRMPLVALLLYVFVVRPSGQPLRALSTRSWVLLVGSGWLGMGLGAWMFLTALARLGPAKAVTLTSASPVFGLLLAVVCLRERVGPSVLAGAACCLAGVWVVL